jgi:putative protein kinase ArgK-like GTPase of G3E family
MKPRLRPPVSSRAIGYGSPEEPNSLRNRPWITSARPKLVQRLQHGALDQHPEGAHGERHDEERPPVADTEAAQQEIGAEGAQHVLGAVREVDDVEQPEDHRQAERQERVERAVDQADQQLAEQRRRRDAEDLGHARLT